MLLVHPVREVVRFLPVVLTIFIAGSASGGEQWQFLGVIVPVVLGLLRYLTTRYRIAADRIELRSGLLNRHVLSTPVDRVRTVDLSSSPIHRVLGLTTLKIGTGTTSSEDRLDLDGLPAQRARQLRDELLPRGPQGQPDAGEDGSDPTTDEVVVTFDRSWLRFAPLTSSGLVIAAGLLGVGSQALNAFDAYDDLDPSDWSVGLPLWTAVALSVVSFVGLVTLLSVAGYLVTNWRFRLTRAAGAWHVSRGLLTTRETSLDQERVAGVTVGEPLSLRLVGGGRLSAIVTGLRASEVGSAVLVPAAPRQVVDSTAAHVAGSTGPLVVPLVDHGPAARRRRWVRACGPALVLVGAMLVVVLATDAPWWLALLPGLAVAAAAGLAVDRVRGLGHALVEGYVVARSGSLTRRREVLEVDHVIGWNLRATWFQRRVGLTSLVATTAGSRQSVTVLDVPERLAVGLATEALPHLVDQFLVTAR